MKKFLTAICIIFFLTSLNSEQLTKYNASWTSVITGKPISNPISTSYGFIIPTDAKNIVAVSTSGNILWDKPITKWSTSIILSSVQNDFFTLVSSKGTELSLYNPSGIEIWKTKTPFIVTRKTFEGRDGRFFINNEKNISCYGMNGICKWSIETPLQKNIDFQTLQDGSIVVFLEKLKEGKTQALRISPFGEILEEITFAGEITNSKTCSEGILLNFSDGNAGLFSILNGRATNRWVLTKANNFTTSSFFVVCSENNQVAFVQKLSSGTKISTINPKNGNIINSFSIENIKNLDKIVFTSKGFFISDSKTFLFYNNEGKEIWNANTNENANILYTYISPDNVLHFLYKDWSINAYKIIQTSLQNVKNREKLTYNSFYDFTPSYLLSSGIAPIDEKFRNEEATTILKKGFYGTKEKELTSLTISTCKEYISTTKTSTSNYRQAPSVFVSDFIGLNNMISTLTLYGTNLYPYYIAELLSQENNPLLIKTLLTSISNNGYDPNEEIIKSIEILINSKTNKNDSILTSICDAIYSICAFMGRPAFNEYGKNLLSKLLYPPYSSNTRNYARETLSKIKKLNI